MATAVVAREAAAKEVKDAHHKDDHKEILIEMITRTTFQSHRDQSSILLISRI